MNLEVVRSGKDVRTSTVVSSFHNGELLETAYAGDIIGIPTTEHRNSIPRPKEIICNLPVFCTGDFSKRSKSLIRYASKQLQLGLAQLGEEGAIQVFRPHIGSAVKAAAWRIAV
ncbi:MAG: hypothetical protein P0107_01755 [Nitrosomonas sp.]|nr:hypothetical protein [Nitrosomonas sp.]